MESPELGLISGFVVDSSVLVSAERGKLTTPEVIRNLQQAAGDVPIVICALTVAELGHGVYHTRTEGKSQQRRRFLDELKQHVPIHPITGATAEIIARVGGEQAAKGVTVPFADLIIGASALEPGYAIATHNVRHFRLIPRSRCEAVLTPSSRKRPCRLNAWARPQLAKSNSWTVIALTLACPQVTALWASFRYSGDQLPPRSEVS